MTQERSLEATNDGAKSKDPEIRADLVSTDYHIGLLAQVTEYQFRVRRAEARLEAEMTRAYEAECALDEARKQLTKSANLQKQLNLIQSSFTWRLGRFLLTPVRIIRRLLTRR